MSSMEKRLEVFSKLPLRAQLATIASSKANPILSKNQDYITSLERIHQASLAAATPKERQTYQKAKNILNR